MKDFLKKIFKSILFDLALVIIFLAVGAVFFFSGGADIISAQDVTTYQALAPLPGFSDKIPVDLGSYVNNLYTLSISLGAIAAIFMIVIGGMQYMTTDNFNNKKDGRARINNALLGLGILLAAFLILNTLNSDLIRLDVELRSAQVQGEIDDVSEEGLTVDNLDAFIVQEKDAYTQLDSAYKDKDCDHTVLGNGKQNLDLTAYRAEAVSALHEQKSKCQGNRFKQQLDNPDTTYTRCVAKFNDDNTRVETCFFWN